LAIYSSVCFKICLYLYCLSFLSLIVISGFLVYFPLSLARRPFDRSFEGVWPGKRVGQIDKLLPYHIYDADATDKKSGRYTKGNLVISATPYMDLGGNFYYIRS
jgi:hypothetical protein